MAKPTFTLREGEQSFAKKASADCWKMPQVTGKRQVSGKVYMTDQRIVFLASGLMNTSAVSWEIEMKDIVSMKTRMTPPCFPFGIELTTRDGGVYLLAIMNRGKYAAWIQEHIS